MVKRDFKTVILFARSYKLDLELTQLVNRLILLLQKQNIKLIAESETATFMNLTLPVYAPQVALEKAVIISIGGDGTLLAATKIALTDNIPVIGINRGTLGFLTDILPQDLDAKLLEVLSGHYFIESRFLFKIELLEKNTKIFEGIALNDVVLNRGLGTRLVEFEVSIDSDFVSHYRADGLIVSTPTGSTAYALSAGGPIMHPKLRAMVLVPMFSHSLSVRPLVFGSEDLVEIYVVPQNEENLQLSCDGESAINVNPGATIRISEAKMQLSLVHPKDYNYYDTLRLKLGWGSPKK